MMKRMVKIKSGIKNQTVGNCGRSKRESMISDKTEDYSFVTISYSFISESFVNELFKFR